MPNHVLDNKLFAITTKWRLGIQHAFVTSGLYYLDDDDL